MGILSAGNDWWIPFPTRLLLAVADLAIEKGGDAQEWEGLCNQFYGAGNCLDLLEVTDRGLTTLKTSMAIVMQHLKTTDSFAGFEATEVQLLLEKLNCFKRH